MQKLQSHWPERRLHANNFQFWNPTCQQFQIIGIFLVANMNANIPSQLRYLPFFWRHLSLHQHWIIFFRTFEGPDEVHPVAPTVEVTGCFFHSSQSCLKVGFVANEEWDDYTYRYDHQQHQQHLSKFDSMEVSSIRAVRLVWENNDSSSKGSIVQRPVELHPQKQTHSHSAKS